MLLAKVYAIHDARRMGNLPLAGQSRLFTVIPLILNHPLILCIVMLQQCGARDSVIFIISLTMGRFMNGVPFKIIILSRKFRLSLRCMSYDALLYEVWPQHGNYFYD